MQGLLGAISGISVYQSAGAISRTQVKFPRSKKKRMQKKWRKDERNYDLRPAAFMISGKLMVHPALMDNLKKRVVMARM